MKTRYLLVYYTDFLSLELPQIANNAPIERGKSTYMRSHINELRKIPIFMKTSWDVWTSWFPRLLFFFLYQFTRCIWNLNEYKWRTEINVYLCVTNYTHAPHNSHAEPQFDDNFDRSLVPRHIDVFSHNFISKMGKLLEWPVEIHEIV